ncbi:MAG: caspase family protein [Mycobacterium sp.]
MLRGGIFVGVNQVKGEAFPKLAGAAAGATAMRDWAVDPTLGAMDRRYVHLITDAKGEVKLEDVIHAVNDVISQRVDQLVLYFSGHGIIVEDGETWLLSRAPVWDGAAISVDDCVRKAKTAPTPPHVVIISDACRTPAKDMTGIRVSGNSVFPNQYVPGRRNRVDVFYATSIGQAALELNTAGTQGIYTEVLLGALRGDVASILAPSEFENDPAHYVWSGPLAVYLRGAVADRLIALEIDEDMVPDENIQYGTENLHYLLRMLIDPARVPLEPAGPRRGPSIGPRPRELQVTGVPGARRATENARNIGELADALLAEATDSPDRFRRQLERAARAPAPGARSFVSILRTLDRPQLGIGQGYNIDTIVKVHGTSIVSAQSADPSIVLADRSTIIAAGSNPTSAPVVLGLANGTAAVVPVLRGFVTQVVVRERGILEISFDLRTSIADSWAYTPNDRFGRQALRRARTIASASAHYGRFQIAADALSVLNRLDATIVDPSLSIYAAYSSNGPDPAESIGTVRRYIGPVFDVEMRAGSFLERDELIHPYAPRPRPFMPLLTRGWGQLDGLRLNNAPMLEELRQWLIPSLWTVFDHRAMSMLVEAERMQ